MKSVAHLVRALLLACALLAAATAGLFAFAPERVAAFDAGWTARHGEVPMRKARELKLAAQNDPAGALPSLDRFIASLADVDRGDRAFAALQSARRARAEALVASGRTGEGLDAALALAREDDRDLVSRIWAGEFLVRTDGGAARGVALLRETFAMLPEMGITTRALHEALVATGDAEGALDVLVHHLTVSSRDLLSMEGLDGPWSLAWAREGESFDVARTIDALPAVTDVYAALTYELPDGVVRIRVDLPARARLAFRRWIVAMTTEGHGESEGRTFRTGLNSSEFILETHQMVFDGTQRLVATGADDPWFKFSIPHGMLTPNGGELRFVVGDPGTPRWMEDALAAATGAQIETSLSRLALRGVLGAETSAGRIAAIRERGLAREEGR